MYTHIYTIYATYTLYATIYIIYYVYILCNVDGRPSGRHREGGVRAAQATVIEAVIESEL